MRRIPLIAVALGILFSHQVALGDLDDFDEQKIIKKKDTEEDPFAPKSVPGEAETGTTPTSKEDTATPGVAKPAEKAPENGSNASKTPGAASQPLKSNTMTQGEGHDNTAPINWKAKGFKGTRAGKLIELKQDVEVNQGKMKLTADRADVYFNNKDDLTKVHAMGNVKIKKDALLPQDRVNARGNEAVFYNAERKVILKGKATLSRGGDVVRGKQISYDLDTGWITVDSVEGIVQPGDTNPK